MSSKEKAVINKLRTRWQAWIQLLDQEFENFNYYIAANMSNRLIIVMGVSGCGKSTIGQGIATNLKLKFYDGDGFHPKDNIEKMASGKPLNDEDRKPWLEAINAFAKLALREESIVIACSALKEKYRLILSKDVDTNFVYLKGNALLIMERVNARKSHFMPPGLLDSQFEILEEPMEAIVVEIDKSPKEIISEAIFKLV